MTADEGPLVDVPAEVEVADRLLGAVTFAMAGWLAAAGLGTALLAWGPGAGARVAGMGMVGMGVAGAFVRLGGRPLAAWVAPLWSYRRRCAGSRPRRCPGEVPAGDIGGQPLLVTPTLGLRDTAGRHALLDELTGLVVGLDQPVQVWHGPVPCRVRRAGVGPIGDFTRRVAAAASVRATVVGGGPDDLPAVVSEHRRGVVLDDGQLARVVALTTWPAVVGLDWLADVTGRCAVTAVHVRPVPPELAGRLLRRRLTSLDASALLDDEAGRLPDETLVLAAGAARELRQALAAGRTRLLYAQVLCGLTAGTADELDRAESAVLAQLAAVLAAGRPLHLQHGPAWRACLPGGSPLGWPWRLLDASSVAATLPHPVGPPVPGEGVLAGVDPGSGSPVLVDRFGAHNPTRLVVGTSGAGKSYAAKLEVVRHVLAGAQVVIVDPEGEFGAVASALGGRCVRVGEGAAGLDPVGLACRPGLAPAEGLAVLGSWASALLGESLSAVDLALLDWALAVLRADRTHTPQALITVVADLAAHPPFAGATLPARLAPAAHGTLAALFAPNPALADPPDVVVFDLRSVPDRARPAVMACVLAWAWAQTVSAPVPRPRLVVVDEAHLLLDDPQAGQLLAQFARRARKYGVALEVVTQRLSDFLGHPAGEAVLGNAATKLLLGCEDHERAAVAAGLGLTAAEAALLRPGTRGRGLLLTPTLRTPIQVLAAPAEHALAAAGPR